MGNTRKTYRTLVGALGGVALVVAMTGCTATGSDAGGGASATPGGTATATPVPSDTPTPTPTTDPAATAAWAAEAVPTSGSDGFIMAQSGSFQDDALGSFTLTMSSLPAGDYSMYLACRGDTDATVTLTVDNAPDVTLASGCSDVSAGITVTTTSDGAVFNVLGDTVAPVEWALAITELLPGQDG